MNEIQEVRTVDMVAAEIRALTSTMLGNIIEIGRRMCEAKEMVPHGSFGEWIKKNTGYSSSTASNFMRLYQEYSDCQTFGKLSYSKALALLALPSGERENFAQEHDVENKSVREINALIKERDEALRRANEEAQAAEGAAMRMAELEECLDDARRREENSDREIAELKDKLSTAEQTAADTRRVLEDLVAENEELRNRPVDVAVEVDQEAIDKAAAEAKAAADVEWGKKVKELMDESDRLDAEKEESRKMQEKEINELHEKLKAAKKAAEEADKRRTEGIAPYEEKIATLEKRLAMSGAEVTAFKLLFSDWQEAFNRMLEALQKVPEENRDKLSGAVKSVLEGQVSRA